MIARDDLVAVQQQHRQQRPLLSPPERDRVPVVATPRAARAPQTAYRWDETTDPQRLRGFCEVARASSGPLNTDPQGGLMSNRVRIFLLALTVAFCHGCAGRRSVRTPAESRRGHARPEHFGAIGRRDRAIGAWNGHRRAFGSAAARWSRVLSDEAMQSSLNASTGPFGFGSALVGSAPVGNGPVGGRAQPRDAHDLCRERLRLQRPVRTVGTRSRSSMRATATRRTSRAARARGRRSRSGTCPSGIAIDERTDTVYVSNFGDNTVSVINGATCNAMDTPAAVRRPRPSRSGRDPIGIFADPANHTVYVANFNDVHRLDDRQRDLQRDGSRELFDERAIQRSRSRVARATWT